MSTVRLRRFGSVELDDLIGMCPGHGDGVPYPLWRTNRASYWGDIAARMEPIENRFTGESDGVDTWVKSYEQADIWVEARVSSFSADPTDQRLLGYRVGDSGFLGTQRHSADVVDLFHLSALDLGGAIAASVGLWRPGSRQALAVPGFLDDYMNVSTKPADSRYDAYEEDDDDGEVRLSAHRPRSAAVTIGENDLTLLGTVQSRIHQRTVWDVDWTRPAVAWIRVRDDGDYVYSDDYSHVSPLTPQILQERIDKLIVADVVALRNERGLY